MNMLRILTLLVLILFSITEGSALAARKRADKKEALPTQPQPILSSDEKFYLETWMHAAKLGEEVRDYETAIMYYTKVKEYFPDTKEGVQAEKRLKVLNAGSE